MWSCGENKLQTAVHSWQPIHIHFDVLTNHQVDYLNHLFRLFHWLIPTNI